VAGPLYSKTDTEIIKKYLMFTNLAYKALWLDIYFVLDFRTFYKCTEVVA